MFASAAEDVRVWSSTSLDLCWKFDVGSSSKLSGVSWSTDGKQLLSVVHGCDTVQVTEFAGGQPHHTLSHVGVVCSCGQLSPCDDCACLGACDGTVLLWDTKNRTAIESYKPHNKTATHVAFANDGSLVVSASCDGSVAVRGLDSKGTLSICEPTGKAVTALESSPHNAFRFVFATLDGCVFVWDGDAPHPLQKHQLCSLQGISGLSLSPVHETLVASVGLDGRLVLFDTATASEQASVRAPESLESVSFLMDGQRLVVGGASGRLYLYDLRRARQEPPVTLKHPHATPVTAICTACHVPAEVAQMAMSASAGAAKHASWTKRPHLDLPVRFALNSESDSPDCLMKMSTPICLPGPAHGQGDSETPGVQFSFTKETPRNDSTHSAFSPGDFNVSTTSQDSVFAKEQPAEASNFLDASWRSSYSTCRQPFRLSDIMPVLPGTPLSRRDSRVTLPRPSTASQHKESAKAEAIEDNLVESPAAGSGGSVSEIASPASNECSKNPKQDSFRGVASSVDYPSLRRMVEGLVDEWGHRLDAHIRHAHMQLTMMQHSYMMEVQAMNQQLFDEVLALRTDIEQLRSDG